MDGKKESSLGTTKTPKSVSIIKMIQVDMEVVSEDCIMPKRTVSQFWTMEGEFVGEIDPLDQFPSINSSASYASKL